MNNDEMKLWEKEMKFREFEFNLNLSKEIAWEVSKIPIYLGSISIAAVAAIALDFSSNYFLKIVATGLLVVPLVGVWMYFFDLKKAEAAQNKKYSLTKEETEDMLKKYNFFEKNKTIFIMYAFSLLIAALVIYIWMPQDATLEDAAFKHRRTEQKMFPQDRGGGFPLHFRKH